MTWHSLRGALAKVKESAPAHLRRLKRRLVVPFDSARGPPQVSGAASRGSECLTPPTPNVNGVDRSTWCEVTGLQHSNEHGSDRCRIWFAGECNARPVLEGVSPSAVM